MKKKDKLLLNLQNQIVYMISNCLTDLFPKENEGDLIFLKILFEKMDQEVLMNKCIKYLLPQKKKIQERKEKFFYKENGILAIISEQVGSEQVKYFKDVIKNLEQEDKNEIWAFLDTFISIVEEYKKLE